MTDMFPPLITPELALQRLGLIFPTGAFDTATHNPLAAHAVAAMVYMGSVVPDDDAVQKSHRIVRPTSCLWLQSEVWSTHQSDSDRASFHVAAASNSRAKTKTIALVESWGITFNQPYADGTREPLRDETFHQWFERGAIKSLGGIQTNYPNARWALAASFAALFDPALVGEELFAAVEAWRGTHLSAMDMLRVHSRQENERRDHAVFVNLPNGVVRELEPGAASHILKGVVEQWAPARLAEPIVLTISEPGDQVYLADGAVLARLGMVIDRRNLLPDAVIVDVGTNPAVVWIIEAVHSDGPVTESRKQALTAWARDQHLREDALQFLSAFPARNHSAARKRLKDLAVGTFAWYLDEPTRELSWHEMGT